MEVRSQVPVAIAITDLLSADRPLKQNHCASTFHWLTLDVAKEASDVWFILEASHARNMEARPSTESQPIFMTESEFLSSPFPVFRHVQSAGDLLVIPPRWYAFDDHVARNSDPVAVSRRIFGKDRLFPFHGHACQSTV